MPVINIGLFFCYLTLLVVSVYSKPVDTSARGEGGPMCGMHGNQVLDTIRDRHSLNIVGTDKSFEEYALKYIAQSADIHALKAKDFWYLHDTAIGERDDLIELDDDVTNNDDVTNDSNEYTPEQAEAWNKLFSLILGRDVTQPVDENDNRSRRKLTDEEIDDQNTVRLCKSEPIVERRFDKFPFIKINWSCRKNRLVRNIEYDCIQVTEERPILKIAAGCQTYDTQRQETWEYSTETVVSGCQAVLKYTITP